MSKLESVPAVVLAAGTKPEPVCQATGVPHKAMVEIAGRAVVSRVVDALRGAQRVAAVVVVVAPDSPVPTVLDEGVAWVESAGESFVDTIKAGLAYHRGADRVLLVTCDLALLTPKAVDHFVTQALDSGAELCYSMVRAERSAPLYGPGKRLVVRLADGAVTGGNLALVSRDFVQRESQRFMLAFAARKKPFSLARLLGAAFIWRYFSGRLTVADIQARARQLLGCEAMVVDSPYPEVCFDLDEPEHIPIVVRHLRDS